MELIDHLRTLRRHWVWLTACTLVGAAAAVVWVVAAPRSYRADAEVFVTATVSGAAANPAARSASQYVLNRMPTYAALVDSQAVTNRTAEQLRVKVSTVQVRAFAPAGTSLIQLTATASTRAAAAALANATAAQLGQAVREIETPPAGVGPRVTATVSQPAQIGAVIASPGPRTVGALGVAGGLLVGLLAATAREQAARRAETSSRVRRELAQVPQVVAGASGAPTSTT